MGVRKKGRDEFGGNYRGGVVGKEGKFRKL